MDVRYGSTADGAAVIQYRDNGGSNQKWRLTDVGSGNYTLTAQHSSKCLDLLSTSNANSGRALPVCRTRGGSSSRPASAPTGSSRSSAESAWPSPRPPPLTTSS